MSDFIECLGRDGDRSLTSFEEAVVQVLADGIPVKYAAGSRIHAVVDHTREYAWAVFASHHPSRTATDTNRVLRQKVRASKSCDEKSYKPGSHLNTDDLMARSGTWPTTESEYVPAHYACVMQRHPLVVCDRDGEKGFCSLKMTAEYTIPNEEVSVRLELRSLFVAAEVRNRGYGRALVTAVSRVVVEFLKDFRDQFKRTAPVSLGCPIIVVMEGTIISEAGMRFVKGVCAELEVHLGIAKMRQYTSRTDLVNVVEIDGNIAYLYKIGNR